jgi:hypothetical protein
MSEYQYYHFLAIDVPLDEDQREELRELSSRAEITANSFINEYNWGDFRGRPEELMERYFDAFLYVANWGSRRLMFRLPREQLDAKTIGQYLYTDVASVSETAEHVIISLSVEPYDSLDDWTEPDGQLAAMVPVRSDLAAGDLRLAYLGWLLAIDWDEIDEEDVEPPVPAGLDRLNGPLRAIADFLSIDKDLLAEAATASPALSKAGDQADISGWIAGLPDAEKTRCSPASPQVRAATFRRRCSAASGPASRERKHRPGGARSANCWTRPNPAARHVNRPKPNANGSKRNRRKPRGPPPTPNAWTASPTATTSCGSGSMG